MSSDATNTEILTLSAYKLRSVFLYRGISLQTGYEKNAIVSANSRRDQKKGETRFGETQFVVPKLLPFSQCSQQF